MSTILFLNGDFLASETARIDPSDRGLLLGDGLFETIRCSHGQPIASEAHWKRLNKGAHILKIPLPLSYQDICQHISQLLSINQLDQCDAGIRLTITRGATEQRGLLPPPKSKPTVLITCFPISPPEKDSISLMLSDVVINEYSPLAACKTLGYAENLIARQQAVSQNYDDALLCNTKGQLTSATSANLFLVINQELHTPALSCGALPGITRHRILQIAKQHQITTYERTILPKELETADEAFLTNSLYPVLPAHRFGQHEFKKRTFDVGMKLLTILNQKLECNPNL